MTMQQPTLAAQDVTRSFRSGNTMRRVIQGISLELFPGTLTALQGRSGSGKTALLNLLSTLDRPDTGRIFLEGREVTALPDRELDELRRTRIGFIFQSVALIGEMNARENVEFHLLTAGWPRDEISGRVLECLRAVGLENRAGFQVQELSGGEQQRVAVARAIANRPGIIFADEPTAALDEANGIRIVSLLKRIAAEENSCVVMSTHSADLAALADRVLTIRDGVLT